MGWAVFPEAEVPFVPVSWGRTKVLVGRSAPAGKGRTDKVLVKVTEYLPGYVHEMHVHPEQDEIIFVLSGQGISETEEGRAEIRPGDVVHVPAGTKHATLNPGEVPLRAVVIKSPPD